jgi:hypothetical protein
VSKTQGSLNLGRLLTRTIQKDAVLGGLFQKVQNAINTLASNTASSAVGRLAPPPPINGLSVSVGGEFAHVVIQHAGSIQQGIHYFVEAANNPNFSGAHPIHYGTSRTRDPIHLAALDASGNPQKWYLRAYAQYPGSDPSKPVVYGGASPIAIEPTGTTRLTWNTSTGSGTASNTGQQVGWGFGKISRRTQ